MEIYSQNQAILKALQNKDRLTPYDILVNFGSLRASARIWDLRSQGHNIRTEMVKIGKKRVARYFLEN